MEKMKFKCTLLSDIVLSQNSSTEGNQYCLDFIPGNNFLGIVAAGLYDRLGKDGALEVFHSGKVKFGDAHPSIAGGVRGLKVPGAMFYPKLAKASEECYVHHLIPNPDSEDIAKKQLKQCREGFYSFGQTGKPVSVCKNFALKSAYDAQKRCSKEGQMFGYESLPEGLVLYFEIESGLDDGINAQIRSATVGVHHIGRSRTAQYGLVRIEEEDYAEATSTGTLFSKEGKTYATVYADGRLIFLDDNAEPTFQPTARDLGFGAEAKVRWELSQVRTFQYSPWNGKRNTFDTDRCGIEKGSVIVVECAQSPSESAYRGSYKNEGFGKVIYNPAFLAADAQGRALCKLEEKPRRPKAEEADDSPLVFPRTPLFAYLSEQKSVAEGTSDLYKKVNDFAAKYAGLFQDGDFASQWGNIRSIASEKGGSVADKIEAYIGHGVAQAKWEEKGRKNALLASLNEIKNEESKRNYIINLASEMAKKCR